MYSEAAKKGFLGFQHRAVLPLDCESCPALKPIMRVSRIYYTLYHLKPHNVVVLMYILAL